MTTTPRLPQPALAPSLTLDRLATVPNAVTLVRTALAVLGGTAGVAASDGSLLLIA